MVFVTFIASAMYLFAQEAMGTGISDLQTAVQQHHHDGMQHEHREQHQQRGEVSRKQQMRRVPRRMDGSPDYVDTSFTLRKEMPVQYEPADELPSDVEFVGRIKVKNAYEPPDDLTAQIMDEERNDVCMHELSLFACMELYGSYGIRRLLSRSFREIKDADWKRTDWMADKNVQASKVMKVTFPMSHAAGAYDVVGAPDQIAVGTGETASSLTQNLDVFQQLELGVRALEMDVVVSTAGQLFTTHNGLLNVPLVTVLRDVNDFLTEHGKEVVVLSLRRGVALVDEAESFGPHASYETLETEEREATTPSATTLPGERAHRLVEVVLGSVLATHDKLKAIADASADPDDPTVTEYVSAKARLLYFWGGQQVLCTNRAQCSQIPGWQAPTPDAPFAFGAPSMPLGTRRPEPFCLDESSSNEADLLAKVKHLHAYLVSSDSYLPSPKCYPGGTAHPLTPPILLVLDAYGFQANNHVSKEALAKQLEEPESFTQGEALTARSMAERMNFLLLSWIFKRSSESQSSSRSSQDQEGGMLFRRANFIALDFVHPTIIHRIVEENQGVGANCDVAMRCHQSGGCDAMSRLKDGSCMSESQAQSLLNVYDVPGLTVGHIVGFVLSMLLLCCLSCILCKLCVPYNCCPTCKCSSLNCGCVWYKKGYAGPPDGFGNGAGADGSGVDEDEGDKAKDDGESVAPSMSSMDAPGTAKDAPGSKGAAMDAPGAKGATMDAPGAKSD